MAALLEVEVLKVIFTCGVATRQASISHPHKA